MSDDTILSPRSAEPRQAVALGYDMEEDEAPRVVAKGEGELAERIIRIAEEHGVTVREDADLVTLLSLIELDMPIPVEAYTAVAEILSYIYQANAATKGAAS